MFVRSLALFFVFLLAVFVWVFCYTVYCLNLAFVLYDFNKCIQGKVKVCGKQLRVFSILHLPPSVSTAIFQVNLG